MIMNNKILLRSTYAILIISVIILSFYLYYNSDANRAERIKALGKQDIDRLIEGLNDESRLVQESAALTLGKIGGLGVIEPLAAMMTNCLYIGTREVAGTAFLKIVKNAGHNAVLPLIEILKSNHRPEVKRLAMLSLGEIGDPRAIEPLIALMNNYYLGKDATSAIVKIGSPAVKPLINGLSGGLRQFIDALGRIGDPRAIEPLNCFI
jgi:HEAT repeat protein